MVEVSAATFCRSRAVRRAGDCPGSGRQGGFTLLEVLVAFTVFALMFGVMMQVLSGAMKGAGRSDEYTQAALWAQSKLAAVGIEAPVEEGSSEGQFDDDYSWRLDIRSYQGEEGGSNLISFDELPPVDLYHVELVINWGESRPRQARFVTLRSTTAQAGR